MSDPDDTDRVRASGAPLTIDELEQLARLLERIHATAPAADLEVVEAMSRLVNRLAFRRWQAGDVPGRVDVEGGCYL